MCSTVFSEVVVSTNGKVERRYKFDDELLMLLMLVFILPDEVSWLFVDGG